ncbi:MAG: methyltransferase domain-containing protein [Candidatus Taylorbacteria bacterium]|nr:methyltransferase domain-containing protein [Candidatus Taylorbacteria bacterium]
MKSQKTTAAKKVTKIEVIKKILRPIKFTTVNFFRKISHRVQRFFNPPRLPENKNNKVFIHLGCGNKNNNEYINVDALPFPRVHYISRVEKLSMFPNNYADLVYASHVLEHVSHLQLLDVLHEWKRIIKPGGTLRLSVPDFDKIISIYETENKKIESIIGPLMGGQDYDFNFHKSIFNEFFLNKVLKDVGFNKVSIWDPNTYSRTL